MASHVDIGPARVHGKMNSAMADVSFVIILITKLIFLYSSFVHMLRNQRNIELLLIQTLFACALLLRVPYWLEVKDKKLTVHIVTLLVLTLLSLLMYAFPFVNV